MGRITWTIGGKKVPWPPRPFPGIPPLIWETKTAFVRSFVANHNLKPAKQEIRVGDKVVQVVPPWWKYGGPREAHLHLGNEIYLLDKAQWTEFAQGLAKDMGMKLEDARSIEFDSFMQTAIETELMR